MKRADLAKLEAINVSCPRCKVGSGTLCAPLPLFMGERWAFGDHHAARIRAAYNAPGFVDRYTEAKEAENAAVIAGPPPTTPRGRALLAQAKIEMRRLARKHEWDAGAPGREAARRAEEARRVADHAEMRERAERNAARAERAGALDQWDDDDPIGKKRQRLVRWLMRKGVSLSEARLIASRKYRQPADLA